MHLVNIEREATQKLAIEVKYAIKYYININFLDGQEKVRSGVPARD